MKKLPPRLLFLIVAALLAFAVSCGTLADTVGVASQSYVEKRVDAIAEATGVVIDGPPPAQEAPLWLQLVLAGLGVPISVGVTNVIRNANRRRFGEATSVPEAMALGQIPAPKASSGGAA